MSESLYFSVAVFVFFMMAIGLALTVWEFRFGQPRQEEKDAPPQVNARESHRARPELWVESR